jgi:hypothetical protein
MGCGRCGAGWCNAARYGADAAGAGWSLVANACLRGCLLWPLELRPSIAVHSRYYQRQESSEQSHTSDTSKPFANLRCVTWPSKTVHSVRQLAKFTDIIVSVLQGFRGE